MSRYFFAIIAAIVCEQGFARTNVTFKMPDGPSSRSRYGRALLCYVKDAVSAQFDRNCPQEAFVSFDTSSLPKQAQLALIDLAAHPQEEFDMGGLTDWWGQWSFAIVRQNSSYPASKDSLAEFQKVVPFQGWEKEVITRSQIKRKTRIIYRSPATFPYQISVAQTLETDSGDEAAPVRETEVAIERNDGSSNADFFVYNQQGRLSTTSHFPAGERRAPSICMSCHYDGVSSSFQRSR